MTYLDIFINTLEKLGIKRENPEKLLYYTSFTANYGSSGIRFAIGSSLDFFNSGEESWYFRDKADTFYDQGVRCWNYISLKEEMPKLSNYPDLKLFAYLSGNGLQVLKNQYGYTPKLDRWLPLDYSQPKHQKITITL
jgi:hypothetical protein